MNYSKGLQRKNTKAVRGLKPLNTADRGSVGEESRHGTLPRGLRAKK